jgi:phage-related protein (TIGR01555 family)
MKKKLKSIKRTVTDGWANVLSGIGTNLDKQSYARPMWVGLDKGNAESIFSADDIGSKIASIVPDDGTREGIDWIIPSEDSGDITKFLEKEFDRLHIWKQISWAWTLARVYGGSLIYLSCDDGKDASEPLDLNSLRRVNSLVVFDRWQFQVLQNEIISNLDDPDFGKPAYYNFRIGSGELNNENILRIHYSRVLRFDGQRLPTRLYAQNGYWHDSIYAKLYKSIRNYSTSYDSVATIMTDFNQPVFKVEGLAEALAMDQDQLVMKKIETVNLSRSVARAVILDKQDDFSTVGASVGGLAELLRMTTDRLVSGSGIPHTRLLGESPSGLGATGRSELNDYYDMVKAAQEQNLRGPLDYLHQLFFLQDDAPIMPDGFTFVFRPLYQTDEATRIATRKVQADIDAIYIEKGVYDPKTVAKSRFGNGEFSFETTIEHEMLESTEFEDLEERTEKPEPPETFEQEELVNGEEEVIIR